MLFLKALSWETDLWVRVGDDGKKRKIGKENLYLTENQVGRNELMCAGDNHSRPNMGHICAEGFLNLLTKYQFFTKLPQISHIHKNRNKWNCLDQLLLPHKFYGSGVQGTYFFIFASCEQSITIVPLVMLTTVCLAPQKYEPNGITPWPDSLFHKFYVESSLFAPQSTVLIFASSLLRLAFLAPPPKKCEFFAIK